jgi:chemosensory pili system protein ChpA (sensor histidine kinase/response regulator)
VLIVDDGDDLRELAETHLSAAGHEVYGASNGLDALQFLKEHENDPPCILLTDLRMPVLDGWDLVYALKRQSRWANLPVIVCSALIHPDAAPPLLNAKAYWCRRPSEQQFQEICQHCALHHQSWPPLPMPESPDRKAVG